MSDVQYEAGLTELRLNVKAFMGSLEGMYKRIESLELTVKQQESTISDLAKTTSDTRIALSLCQAKLFEAGIR